MDKRTIVFVFLMTITLLFVNKWFAYEDDSVKRAAAAAQEAKQEQSAKLQRKEIDARTARQKDLPLVKLYLDPRGEALYGYGLNFNGAYILQMASGQVPETVYVKSGREGMIPLVEVVDSLNSQKAMVYAQEKDIKLEAAYLPPIGTSDVQIVTLGKDNLDIQLGEFEDGRLYFPEKKPKNNAIALYRYDGQYLPVGFYEASDESFHSIEQVPPFEKIASYRTLTSEEKRALGKEEFYVLENEYLQLVFSNIGGALAEINLPFETKKNPKSVVKAIAFDKDIAKREPANAAFPGHSYWMAENGKRTQKSPTIGGYYPLIRRSLKNSDGKTVFLAPSRYYAMNLVSEEGKTHNAFYTVRSFSKDEIVFESADKNRKVTKNYRLPKAGVDAPYCVSLSMKVDGDSRGLWLTTGVPEVELISGAPSPELQYRAKKGKKSVVEKASLPKTSTTFSTISPDWLSDSNGFFGLILDPLSDGMPPGFKTYFIPGQQLPTRLTLIDASYNLYPADKYPGYEMLIPYKGGAGSSDYRLFAGPYEQSILRQVDATYSNPAIGYNPDYASAQTYHGWFSFISAPFAKFLFILMHLFYKMTHSWGFSIILLTIALRIMLYPLNNWSIRSMTRMQQLAPRVTQIQERYKKDPKKSQMEVMKLYREAKVNPFSGCLPILIQMPFLIGMFDLLKSAFDLRGAVFIPGWIDNLTAPDVLFSWSYPIWFVGTQFHLLPFILGGLMFVQQKMSQARSTPKSSEQASQQKMMGNVMTIVFTVLFYNFPSGLNIYWISSTILAMLQQYLITKKLAGEVSTVKQP